MSFPSRASLQLAHSLLFALIAAIEPANAQSSEPVSLHEAGTTPALIRSLEQWLDANSSYPRRNEEPEIQWIDSRSAQVLASSRATVQGGNPRGFYDAENQTILLVQPWDWTDARDVGVLLHELAHHRQAVVEHWYCPAAQELPAYRLQEAWLAEQGLKLRVNWIAVVLESGCSRRDFHPD